MSASQGATFHGVPLSLISLVTLTCQNSALTILLHVSRTSAPPGQLYSAASAVLLNELLKGTISIGVAYRNVLEGLRAPGGAGAELGASHGVEEEKRRQEGWRRELDGELLAVAAAKLVRDVFSRDCWKLGCPAVLYVIQNNLQFVAASNLDVPTFQVTYNLKILTTALFSVLLLRRRLTSRKWGALAILFLGVAIVQLQSTAAASGGQIKEVSHEVNRVKGLMAVAAACMTSGLAGCYFELVLKGSKVDLWVRNAQLCVFSIVPAFMPVFFPTFSLFGGSSSSAAASQPIFAYFGLWAWAVVLFQVMGGLVTALVIKFSDNIMKGFATSLAIVLSFLAGVILFNFHVTLSFLLGTCLVVGSTYLYNQPEPAAAGRSHRLLTNPKEEDDARYNLTPPTSSYRPGQQSWLEGRTQSPQLGTSLGVTSPVMNGTRHVSNGSINGGVHQFATRRTAHVAGPLTPDFMTTHARLPSHPPIHASGPQEAPLGISPVSDKPWLPASGSPSVSPALGAASNRVVSAPAQGQSHVMHVTYSSGAERGSPMAGAGGRRRSSGAANAQRPQFGQGAFQ